jgi:hypothetical protein
VLVSGYAPKQRHVEALYRLAGDAMAAELLRELGTRQAVAMLDRYRAVLYARRLLDDGLERRTVATRLMVRFGISRATASRRIGAALRMGLIFAQNRPPF